MSLCFPTPSPPVSEHLWFMVYAFKNPLLCQCSFRSVETETHAQLTMFILLETSCNVLLWNNEFLLCSNNITL